MKAKNPHVGSSFDDFLNEEGIREDVEEMAVKKAISIGLQDHMKAAKITKIEMAQIIGTSRSQLDRMLDPRNTSVTLMSLKRAATAIGKRLSISLT
jgi:antitoxin HicB